VAINGTKLERMNDVLDASFLMGSERVISIEREGKIFDLELPANAEEQLGEMAQGPYADLPLLSARLPFSVKRVNGTAASKGGMEPGDIVYSIDGQKVYDFFSFKEALIDKAGTTAKFELGKAEEPDSLHRLSYMTISEDGTLGFMPEFGDLSQWEKVVDLDLATSIQEGTAKSFGLLGANAKALGKVFTGKTDPKKTIAGPVGIAQMYGSSFDWVNFWTLTAMLSLVLALMNILPIPALDGGHVVFLLYEMIARRPVSEKVLYVGQIIGMVMLLSLMVFVFWVDISRALGF
jgi:regulator of sigma E protease